MTPRQELRLMSEKDRTQLLRLAMPNSFEQIERWWSRGMIDNLLLKELAAEESSEPDGVSPGSF